MADGGGSKEDQWVLAPAERELVMTKNRANRLGFAILLTFFRPVELFMPELGELRPMLWLWLLAVITSVVAAAAKKEAGARPIHFKLIFGL